MSPDPIQPAAQGGSLEPSGFRAFSQVLLGRPLETSAAPHQAIGKLPALAVFASDALPSVAYATEEILVVLALAGTAFFGLSLPIALAIALLLVLVTLSYRQTIFAYPAGGGASGIGIPRPSRVPRPVGSGFGSHHDCDQSPRRTRI